jgi:transglutaminase-like putative cysteine protease
MAHVQSVAHTPTAPHFPVDWRDATGLPPASMAHKAPPRVRMELQIDLSYDIVDPYGADFIFNIHAAQTPSQAVSNERLVLNQDIATQVHTDPATRNRYLRLHGEPGVLELSYSATVDITHHRSDPARLAEVPVRHLPQDVLGYIYPSRYCQSDRLLRLANNEFGALWQGHGRVQAICDWVRRHVAFTSNTSNFTTAAVDTLIEQVGVCRDFAHLMIALCRAVNIPARFTSGTDYGADPALGPPDFHAYVEVFLGDRWYIFDPSGTAIPMGLLRFGTGRDAADVAFATIFGGVKAQPPVIRARAVEDAVRGFVLPEHCADALSTDHGAGTLAGLQAV